MTRFLRWGYLLPRLLVVFALLCLSEYGAAWLAKRTVRSAGQATLGARIDLAQSKASLLQTCLEFQGLQVADPDAPLRNLVEADSLVLDFDADSLLRKKLVVSRGAVRGLQFGTPRVASGKLPGSPPRRPAGDSQWLSDDAVDHAGRWLTKLSKNFASDFQDRFQSVRVARELRNKWPGRYDQIAADANQIHADALRLKQQVVQARENPLRNASLIQSAPHRVATLKSKIEQLQNQLAGLPALVEADRQAVLAAKRHDEKLIRQTLNVEPIDSASLTTFLLGEQLGPPAAEIIAWLRWARQLAPSRDELAAPQRGRGVNVLFQGIRPRPDLLVEKLHISGAASFGGRQVEVSGALTDYTTQPHLHGKPLRLTIATAGDTPLSLQATIDRTGPTPRDQLLADCQSFPLPKLHLGGTGHTGGRSRIGMTLEPSAASLHLALQLDGDQLSGELRLVQQQLEFTPGAEPSDATASLAAALAKQLQQLPSITTRVGFSGTLERPQWELQSDLGPAFALAMESAARGSIERHTVRLLAATEKAIDAQLAGLDRELATATEKLGPLLSGESDLLGQLSKELLADSPLRHLGKKLPKNPLQLK